MTGNRGDRGVKRGDRGVKALIIVICVIGILIPSGIAACIELLLGNTAVYWVVMIPFWAVTLWWGTKIGDYARSVWPK